MVSLPRQLIDKIGQAASGYDPIRYLCDGWEMRQGIHGGVIAFPVRPSYPLKKLTASLAELLSPLAHSHNIWDANPESKWFHVTIANRMDPKQASAVFSALTNHPKEESPPGIFSRLRDLVQLVFSSRKGHAVQPITLDDDRLQDYGNAGGRNHCRI